jgi:hypothetical protein
VKAPEPGERYLPWADLMVRVHEADVLECGKCGGRMKVTALVTDKAEAREILTRLGSPSTKPMRASARGPPRQESFEARPGFYPDEPWTDEVGSL